MELLLIFAIMVFGTIAAVVLIRNQLIELVANRQAARLTVKDSTAPDPFLLGTPVSYDLCEAPQILCPDFGFDTNNNGMAATPGTTDGLRALVGIRPDRFVTRNQIYFTGDNCTGTPYIAPPPLPGSTNFPPELPVGYFNCGIQVDSMGAPICYGAGPPSEWGTAPCDTVAELPCSDGGRLYRSDGTTTSMPAITSRWISLNPDCAELGGGGVTDICDDAFDTNSLDLLPAIEVTDMAGANVLAPYAPLFNVMAPVAPEFGEAPATHETGPAPVAPPPVPATHEGT